MTADPWAPVLACCALGTCDGDHPAQPTEPQRPPYDGDWGHLGEQLREAGTWPDESSIRRAENAYEKGLGL